MLNLVCREEKFSTGREFNFEPALFAILHKFSKCCSCCTWLVAEGSPFEMESC